MKGTWQTTDSGGRGGLVLIAVIAAAALIGSGAASAAVSALVTIVAIVTGCVVGLAVLGGIAWLVYRARSDRSIVRLTRKTPTGASKKLLTPEVRPQLEESHKPAAIGPGREVHYHFNVSAAELAAIMRRYDGED